MTTNEDKMRRVVITGTGLVTPIGCGVGTAWERLLRGQSGIRKIEEELSGKSQSKIAGIVQSNDLDPEGGLNLSHVMSEKEANRTDRFVQFALTAADEAINQANLSLESEDQKNRAGVIIATGIGGFLSMMEASNKLAQGKKLSPFTIPSFLSNMATAYISIKYHLKGVAGTPVTACAASVQSIGDGFRIIKNNEADVMVVGGSEACIHPVALEGFSAAKALSTKYNATPELASRPFDSGRDGFVMSEGSGVLVLEELEHAINRGAKPLAELVGYGTTSDAYHITAPSPDGSGAARAMGAALKSAGITEDEICYINAHATSTNAGDKGEILALKQIFKKGITPIISSTKSATGHLLGAAGAVGTIFTTMTLLTNDIPSSLNLLEVDEDADYLNFASTMGNKLSINDNYAMINGFGFGGVNASLILKKFR